MAGEGEEMKVLHITPHLGGGVGTVIMDWMDLMGDGHSILCLDYINVTAAKRIRQELTSTRSWDFICREIEKADVVLVHYWDHSMLASLLAWPLPPCRLALWCHKNITAQVYDRVWWEKVLNYPDRFVATSPIIHGATKFIWSTGNMDRFFHVQKLAHQGIIIGYAGTVDYKKMHKDFIPMCLEIKHRVPDARFLILGEVNIHVSDFIVKPDDNIRTDGSFRFMGKVDDIAPYLGAMDVFGYPLRPDHYGTCEQVLGEAMSAGVPVVTMNNPAEQFISPLCAETTTDYIEFVVTLCKDREARENQAILGRARAGMYNIRSMIHQWDNVFMQMMKEDKRERDAI
jgi:glycosyltransferase involved in cell wall biosynthesis